VIALETVVMLAVALIAAGVVLTRDPLPQMLVFLLYGTALAVLFLVLQAPDVALSAIVIGLAYPVMILLTLQKIRERKK
jgi:energy-converting hydrogenase B subunit D